LVWPLFAATSAKYEQKWFEMMEIRKRRFDSAVWIPLRASQKIESGKWGYLGHRSEFFGAGSLAVPLRKRDAAASLGWTELGLSHDHGGYADRGRYVAADECEQLKGLSASDVTTGQFCRTTNVAHSP
jgi:hypothetical protein